MLDALWQLWISIAVFCALLVLWDLQRDVHTLLRILDRRESDEDETPRRRAGDRDEDAVAIAARMVRGRGLPTDQPAEIFLRQPEAEEEKREARPGPDEYDF